MSKKTDSIGLRITKEHKEIIRLAAGFNGQGISNYLISAALKEAKKDILLHKEILARSVLKKKPAKKA